MKYLLDSNVFDYILDNKIEVETISNKGDIYITNIRDCCKKFSISSKSFLSPSNLATQ